LAALTESRRAAGDAARVLIVALARLAALLALAAAAARRETTLLLDFAFADRAALLLAADRDGRDAEEPTTDLRLRDAVDRADALAFFETVLDAFLVAFLRAAMA
jgi:ABC-type nitrate/sulfonate/bicarbonate transport system substrate-binding protein